MVFNEGIRMKYTNTDPTRKILSHVLNIIPPLQTPQNPFFPIFFSFSFIFIFFHSFWSVDLKLNFSLRYTLQRAQRKLYEKQKSIKKSLEKVKQAQTNFQLMLERVQMTRETKKKWGELKEEKVPQIRHTKKHQEKRQNQKNFFEIPISSHYV